MRILKKEYFKRVISWLLILCMTLQMDLVNGSFPILAATEADSVFCFTEVEVKDKDGTDISTDRPVSIAEPIYVRYNFKIENSGTSGAQLTFKLPEQIGIYDNLNFRLVDEDSKYKFAEVDVKTDGTGVIKLLDASKYLTELEGWFEIKTFWNAEDIPEGGETELVFEIQDLVSPEFTVRVDDADITANMDIEKTGKVLSSGNIEWTIKVTPKTSPIKYPIKHVVITDTITPDQTLVVNSGKVYKSPDNASEEKNVRAVYGFDRAEVNEMPKDKPASHSNASKPSSPRPDNPEPPASPSDASLYRAFSVNLEPVDGIKIINKNTSTDGTVDEDIFLNEDENVDEGMTLGEDETVDEDMTLDEDETVDEGMTLDEDETVDEDMTLDEDETVDEDMTLDEDETVDEGITSDEDLDEDIELNDEEDIDFKLPARVEVKADDVDLNKGFEYNGNTLTYAFPIAIQDSYTISFETTPNGSEMTEDKFNPGNTEYTFGNEATVGFPADAKTENGETKVETADAETIYPIEYIKKDGKIIDEGSEVLWTITVNKSHMPLERAYIQDTLVSEFLELDFDRVHYGTKKLTRCLTHSPCTEADKFTYDDITRIIRYNIGETSESNDFTYYTSTALR